MRVLRIKVKPNSKASVIEEQPDGTWLARLKSPPVDGKANKELIALVADHFGCAKSSVSIKSGQTSQLKLVQITAD